MKKKGAYITTNLTAFDPGLLDIPAVANVPASLAKAKSASATFANYIPNMKKCPAKRGFQTDCVGSVAACNIQVAYEKYLNNEFFGPHTSLVTMTSVGGEIVWALSRKAPTPTFSSSTGTRLRTFPWSGPVTSGLAPSRGRRALRRLESL
jgi:hypothetical protein